MAQPALYSRDYSFVSFQNANPTKPLPAAQLEAELDAVAETLEQTLENLALIQRDDGLLANNSVHPDAVRADVWAMVNGWNPRGDWAAVTAYAFKDVVRESDVLHVCLEDHTSSAAFATDEALGRWMQFTVNIDSAADALAAAASADEAEIHASAADTSADEAEASATAAAASAVDAAAEATAAAASAVAAAASAEAAAAAEASLPAVADNATKYLRVNAGGTAYEGRLPSQVVSDLIFQQTGTGASDRSLLTKIREVSFSVTDFGAVGDNSTDNLAAFNACYAAAKAILDAGVVPAVKIKIPRGKYRLSDEWNIYRPSSPRRDLIIEGEDQLATELVANFYGAGKALIRGVDPAGTSRCSPTSFRHLGFEVVSQSGGTNPVYIRMNGYGESRLVGLRGAPSNNSHFIFESCQNIRGQDVVSFGGGRHFQYKDTDGLTFSMAGGTITCTNGNPFTADDVGKHFWMLPSNVQRQIRYTIASFIDGNEVTVSESNFLAETAVAGQFETARGSIVISDTTFVANAPVFTSDMVGMVLYIRSAEAGAWGQALLRARIASFTNATTVELDTAATRSAVDSYFGVAAVDFCGGTIPGETTSSDVQIAQLHVEHYQGLGFVGKRCDTYHITGKLHSETNPSVAVNSTAAMWLDDFAGKFELWLGSTYDMSNCHIFCCNLNDLVQFDSLSVHMLINDTIIRTPTLADAGGLVDVRSLLAYDSNSDDERDLFSDANYIADNTDPRIIVNGVINQLTDAGKARVYAGPNAYFSLDGLLNFNYTARSGGVNVNPGTTYTWDGTAPGGILQQRMSWQRVGNVVFVMLRAEYQTAGATNTTVDISWPAALPTPAWLAFTDNSEAEMPIAGSMSADANVFALTRARLRRDGSGNPVITVALNSSNIAAKMVAVQFSYFTAD